MVKLDLPDPDTPVMQVKVPSGIDAVTPAQVVGGRVVDGQLLAGALAALGRQRHLARAAQIVGGDAVGAGEQLLERPVRDPPAACTPAPGPMSMT
jgi:hypothetical protein